ncbi:CcdB family protein [Sphingomonas sp. LT1P40]|uniref:CcdB family protein n=1 Tax=Alteristakelama amylovorans TaxID=3096166 RepID=UPI002FC7F897
MAQFDVHRTHGAGLLLDCQNGSLAHLRTRIVVPLIPVDTAPAARDRLHPVFDIHGQDHLLATHLVATVPTNELGKAIASLASEHHIIVGAFDRLLTGV